MDSLASRTALPSPYFAATASPKLGCTSNKICYAYHFNGGRDSNRKIQASVSPNGSISSSASDWSESRAVVESHRRSSSPESIFCYDKAIPEERIETPVGLSLAEKVIGDNPKCNDCHAKGAVLCATCSGCGLYVDSILESQGIIVKVRCLGCGGSGNMMCPECGGRGHLGEK